MSTILIVILILFLVGAFGAAPIWPYSQGLGWGPSGGIGVVLLIIIVVMVVTGKL